MKRSVIISNIHDVYELPYELPNELKLRKLEKLEIRKDQNNLKTPWNYNPAPSSAPKKKTFSILAKDSL